MATLRNWRGPDVVQRYTSLLEQRMDVAGAVVEAAVKRSLGGPSPSRPGSPPGLVTGVLQGGVTHRVERRGGNVIGLVGVANVVYAKFLEFGTSRMAARPFLRPGVRENLARIRSILARGR